MSNVPRPVPLSTRLSALFATLLGQIGWALLSFGSIFAIFFVPARDLAALVLSAHGTEAASGIVVSSEETGASENKKRVHRMRFSFETGDGRTWTGISYATGSSLPEGTEVTVEYPRGHPGLSRIAGMRRSTFGLGACFVIVFPLVGLGLAMGGILTGLRAQHLLAHGQLALGKLRSKTPTNVRINNRTVYAIDFEFQAQDGSTHTATARTHLPEKLEDEAEELLLYDPERPEKALMADTLPGGARLDPDGQIEPTGMLRALSALILPFVALAILSLGAIFKMSP